MRHGLKKVFVFQIRFPDFDSTLMVKSAASPAAVRGKRVDLGRKHKESGAGKVHDHLAGARIVPANRDMLR